MTLEMHEDEINMKEVLMLIFDGKWLITSITIFASLIGIYHSLSLPDIYKSQAILSPVELSQNKFGSLDSYSSLVSLSGINIQSQLSDSNISKAIEKINSLSFFKDSIMPYIFLPDLMAVGSWQPKSNIITYDKNIYDEKTGSWVRDFSFPQKQIPSAQESFKKFKNEHLTLIEDNNGFILLTIRHQSPFVAKEWTNLIVDKINSFYRSEDKQRALKAIDFLNLKINQTNLAEIKQVIAGLLQEETKKLALIEANDFYVFSYIDPPAVMEVKSEPKRLIICLISALLGVLIGTFFVLMRHIFLPK